MHGQGQKWKQKHTTKNFIEFQSHSPLSTMDPDSFFFLYLQDVYPASRVSFDPPRKIGKGKETLPLPDFSRKIEGDSARRVQDVLSDICLLQGHGRLQLHTRNQTMLYSWNSWKTPGFLKKKSQVPGKLIEISNLASTPGKSPEFIYWILVAVFWGKN